ncbi:tRNA-dihydrouridine synthase family protein [Acetivibrio mesophilus]|uniref:tRNA-dihydrouridine synthase n=1 Tax=Acetivibrio mesophilus TaxID=2487273 RepID=A0A4Q0I1T9_9FIRM|nr:tRNA-dihydrouridine synthase family protein [Acetivibrio mesophilus]ODM27755.1 dihydrouridine synthase [Clostridium sp. Bc-iso-3]RXE58143.1 tRNA-dihydrouridine synthase family protein [Acetivibrio mesophilus]HHV30565.1 tRNA-dihydrouridine synthase family protein [Clostridium sp.]
MKLFLAPIQGMTIACYRNAFARHFGSIDAYYAPFIGLSETKKISNLLLKDLLPERNDSSINVVPQLLGNDGVLFKNLAYAISAMGYNEINWNIGCPYPMVTGRKRGAGILPYPDMIKKFLDTACSDNSYKVSIKMRLGLKDPEEGLHVMEVLNEYPLCGVIVHARTGEQMYTGQVDLDAFKTLATSCKHEITYNGDISTYDNYLHINSCLPTVKNIMLGRGALSDPFLPSRIKGHNIPSEDKISIIRDFHDDIFNYYQTQLSGDKHLSDKMKELWDYLQVHICMDKRLLKKIKKCHNSSQYTELVNQLFDSAVWIE